MTSSWDPLDLMTVRDAAVADIVPKMTKLENYGGFKQPAHDLQPRSRGVRVHRVAVGKEGHRQYLFSLRKSVIGGGEDAYEEAFKMKAEDFDLQFEKYLKDRFKPFRDKERPADYGRNLAPDNEKTKFSNAISVEPSPSGDLLAVVTGNRRDQEADIILVSSKDGSVIRNLTTASIRTRASSSSSCPACGSIACPGCRGPPRAIVLPSSSATRSRAR
jgi:hypothetical protein